MLIVDANIEPSGHFAASHTPHLFKRMRASRQLKWLNRPAAYAAGTLLLTILGSGATLMAVRILDPVQFGTFALLTSLFTYASRADLGMSQLADKLIPGQSDRVAAEVGSEILAALWCIGAAIFVGCVALVLLIDGMAGGLPVFATSMAVGGGIMGMIANGPVTVFRATSRVWEFTVVALVLQAGMTVPRLGGLLFGGVAGAFAAVTVYYVICALLLARPLPVLKRRPPFFSMVRTALPLFAFNAVWIFYLGANRWISSVISSPRELGLFSFGASLAMIGLGVLSTIAQVRYPAILARMDGRGRERTSGIVERELLVVTLGLGMIAAVAICIADKVVAIAFPAYVEAATATAVLAVACVPLGTMIWIVPVVIARSHQPVRDGLQLGAIALATLLVGMAVGDRLGGIDGQAWGNAIAALLALLAIGWPMRRIGMVTVAASVRICGIQVLVLALLATLSVARSANAAEAPAPTEPSKTGWTTTFEDNFSTLNLQSGSAGIWLPYYPWNSRTNETNNELQYYVDPRSDGDSADVQALKPYSITDGILSISASAIPRNLRSQAEGFAYASGLLNTKGRFSFTYGSVEIRAKMPSGKGLWPAFWLLPVDLKWPPEIDVFEVLGGSPQALHVTVHSGLNIPAGERSAQKTYKLVTSDLSSDFHVYRMTWTKEKLVWSLDGKPIFETATPADLNKPMYLLLNLAVGGWAGSPNAATKLPASLLVDWIRVSQPGAGHSSQAKETTQ